MSTVESTVEATTGPVGAMPYEPSLPCPQCGKGVDPLRAPHALAMDDGVRFLCSAECAEAYREARSRPLARAQAALASASDTGPRGEELVQAHRVSEILRRPLEVPAPPWPAVIGTLLGASAALAGPWGVALSAVLATGLAAWALNRTQASRQVLGPVAWALGPAGVTLIAGAALLQTQTPWLALAAQAAVLVVWLRPWLDERAQQTVQQVVQRLRDQLPRRAQAPVDDATDPARASVRERDTRRVRTGEELLVRKGEVVPVDGEVLAGEARVVPHPGHAGRVQRSAGHSVLAGAVVVDGAIRVRATRVGDARAWCRVESFGSDSQPGAAPITRAAARLRTLSIGALFGLATAALAATVGANWHGALAGLGAAWVAWPSLAILRNTQLPLVAAGVTAAARGIVYRDARALDAAGAVTAAALCNDGTVTEGSCSLVEVCPLGRDFGVDELVGLAAGVQLVAEPHPLALAVKRFAAERGIEPLPVRRTAYTPGRGVTALTDGGVPLVMGNRPLLLSAGVSVAVADREAQVAEASGRTSVFLAVDDRVRAVFVFHDPTRPEARAAVQQLIDQGIEVALLSGDHRTTVETLARPLDITHVKAELNAEERSAEVDRLREAGGAVAVVGHNPDDEGALAAADVPVALDAAGSTGEGPVALASEDLRDAAAALRIARVTRRATRTVLWTSLVLGSGLAAGVAAGLLPPLAVLAVAVLDAWALQNASRLLKRLSRT